MQDTLKIFKALSDPNRVRILKMLEKRDLCVCEITDILNLSNSTVSSHLSLLKDAGFITDQKDGKWVEYKINKLSDIIVLNQILSLLPVWFNDDEYIISDSKKVKHSDRNLICCK